MCCEAAQPENWMSVYATYITVFKNSHVLFKVMKHKLRKVLMLSLKKIAKPYIREIFNACI